MKNSPVSEIKYDESKPVLIIKATSKETQKELKKEFERVSYEAVRDHGLSQKIEVDLSGEVIYLSGNLNVAIEHLSCQKYVDSPKLRELRVQVILAKYGAHLLMNASKPPQFPSPSEARVSPLAKAGEDAVIIHTRPGHFKG